MFLRVVRESFTRAARRKAMAILAVALGTAVATAMFAVSLDVGDKLSRELRGFGANIEVTPAADSLAVEVGGVDYRPVAEGRLLAEATLPKLKTIFWRNAIAGFAPFLHVPAVMNGRGVVAVGTWFDFEFESGGERFRTGLRATNPAWKVAGAWPQDRAVSQMEQALAGRRLGLAPGSVITLNRDHSFRITGVLETGGAEEDQLFVTLAAAQRMAGVPGQFRKLQVSAMIKPDDALARRDPATMSREDYDRWYCTPYVGSISRQVQEVLPGSVARQVRQL